MSFALNGVILDGMCDIPRRKSDYEMTTDDCLNMFKQLKELGVSGISFTGGERLAGRYIFSPQEKHGIWFCHDAGD